ncbi:MAG: VOC family protein [Schleiferiaceae bacterium]|jgi:predicted enzyme related to lactoylglutathione lyase|nr:VOC family protein [Schleiferiaceae bacterium]
MTNAISWFEIPALKYERAKKFYETVLEISINDMHMENMKYGVFPYEQQKGVGGAILESDMAKPTDQGTAVYFNGGDDLSKPLAKVEAAGGKILMPKTNIGENGFMAHILDTEGNHVALHSMN